MSSGDLLAAPVTQWQQPTDSSMDPMPLSRSGDHSRVYELIDEETVSIFESPTLLPTCTAAENLRTTSKLGGSPRKHVHGMDERLDGGRDDDNSASPEEYDVLGRHSAGTDDGNVTHCENDEDLQFNEEACESGSSSSDCDDVTAECGEDDDENLLRASQRHRSRVTFVGLAEDNSNDGASCRADDTTDTTGAPEAAAAEVSPFTNSMASPLDPYNLDDEDVDNTDDDDEHQDDRMISAQRWQQSRAAAAASRTERPAAQATAGMLDARFVQATPEDHIRPVSQRPTEDRVDAAAVVPAEEADEHTWEKIARDVRRSRSQLALMSCNDVHRTFRLHFDDMRNRLLGYHLSAPPTAAGGPDVNSIGAPLSPAQRLRRERLVNTSHWLLDPRGDVLFPEALVCQTTTHNNESAAAAEGGVPAAPTLSLRQHQRDGIRFMWRALMQGPLLKVPAVGCILAHSMGLGKTGQVVVFLNLMVRYYAQLRRPLHPDDNNNKQQRDERAARIRELCPPLTDVPRVVIVAPKSVLAAWESEFRKWGDFFKDATAKDPVVVPQVIDDRVSKSARMEMFTDVVNKGGVLLVGYEALVFIEKDFTLRRAAAASAPSLDGSSGDGPPQFGFEPFQLGTMFDLVVCDEGHRLKSSNLDIAKALSHLYALRRLVLTGTPMQNHLLEYWAMSDFAVPKFFDRRTFLKFFVQPIQHGADGSASEAAVALAKKKTFILVQEFANFTQRVDNEPLRAELPPLCEYVVSVPLSLLQYNLYMKFIDIVRKENGVRFNVLQAFSYASKICAHPQLLLDATHSEGLHSGTYSGIADAMRGYVMSAEDGLKLSIAVKIIKAAVAAGEKTLVFSMSTKMLDLLEALINIADREERMQHPATKRSRDSAERDVVVDEIVVDSEQQQDGTAHPTSLSDAPPVRIKHVRIDGSASAQDRERRIADFQSPSSTYNCFLLSTKAGGVGITVTAATRVILLDCSFNPADDRQAIGRAYRYGQTKPVAVYRLVCRNTIEHRIFDQKVGKEWMFETVVNDKNIKRDGLSGAKLRHIFLMKESLPVCFERSSNKSVDPVAALRAQLPQSVRTATEEILRTDVCLRAVGRSICSVMLYDSYLEADHGERYGAEEAKSYASYRQSGGLQQADFETPELRAQLDREATSQWKSVTSQSVTLSAIIQNLIQDRSESSEATRNILKKLGVVHDDRYNTPLLLNHRHAAADTTAGVGQEAAVHTETARSLMRAAFADPQLRPVAHPVMLLDSSDDSDDDDDDVVEVQLSRGAANTTTTVRSLVDPQVYAPFALRDEPNAMPTIGAASPKPQSTRRSIRQPRSTSELPGTSGRTKDDAFEIDD